MSGLYALFGLFARILNIFYLAKTDEASPRPSLIIKNTTRSPTSVIIKQHSTTKDYNYLN